MEKPKYTACITRGENDEGEWTWVGTRPKFVDPDEKIPKFVHGDTIQVSYGKVDEEHTISLSLPPVENLETEKDATDFPPPGLTLPFLPPCASTLFSFVPQDQMLTFCCHKVPSAWKLKISTCKDGPIDPEFHVGPG